MSNVLRCRKPRGEACATIPGGRVAAEYADFLADESKLRANAAASLAFPESTEQVSALLAAHHRQGHSVVVSGARTGLVGGAVPVGGEHLVSLTRLQGITGPFDAGSERHVRVGAGVSLADLEAHLLARDPGWYYPVDPTETSASVGGTVATDAAGARSLYYGRTRDWVRGLTVVLVDGGVLDLMRGAVVADADGFLLEGVGEPLPIPTGTLHKPACKRALGPDSGPGMDAVDLFIGSEGTLGVITEVALALAARPAHRLVYLQFFADEDSAFAFARWARALRSSAAQCLAVEWLDRRSLDLAARSDAAPRFGAMVSGDRPANAAVFAEIAAADEVALEAVLEQIMVAVEECGADPEQSGVGLESAALAEIRAFRHAVPERINALIAARRQSIPGLTKLATDMAVPDPHLATIYRRYGEVFGSLGLDFAAFGHVGDNHLHVNVLPTDAREQVAAREGYRTLAREVVSLGGAVSAEHGFGRLKREFLAMQFAPEQLRILGRIKGALDPRDHLNPGLLVDPVV